MKNFLFIIAFLFTTALSFAQVSVKGCYRSNGTYVQPHQRTAPNNTRNDNWTTEGNVNPYTGKAGTLPRDGYSSKNTSSTSSYGTPAYKSTYTPSTSKDYSSSSSYTTPTYSPSTYSPSTYSPSTYSTPSYNIAPVIQTGSRGGQYYINTNGNKTYVSGY